MANERLVAELAEINTAFKAGEISEVEAQQLRQASHEEHNTGFAHMKVPPMLVKAWVPPVNGPSKVGLGKLPGNWAIDPKTGALVNLDGSKDHILASKGETDKRRATKSNRFPAGVAVVVGCDANGELIEKRFSVGAACQDPYRAAFAYARDIMSDPKGIAQAWVGYRKAGYVIETREHGNTYLVPGGDGEKGSKGLEIRDAKGYRPNHQELIELVWWCEAVGQFLTKIKLDKDEKAALKTGQVFDLSMFESERGHPFRVRLQNGVTRILRAEIEPEDFRNHAELLACEVWGHVAPQWVEYMDPADGLVRVFRGEALLKHAEPDEDPIVDQLRSGLDPDEPGFDGERFAEDVVKALTPWAREGLDNVHYVDEWRVQHDRAELAKSQDDPEGLAEAQAGRLKEGRGEIPEYVRKGSAMRDMSKGYKAHKWHGRARNSPAGATWDRMRRAQGL